MLLVAEEKKTENGENLLHPTNTSLEVRDRYARFYSVSRIRSLAYERRGTAHTDLYESLKVLFLKLREGYSPLGIPGMGSFLFSDDSTPDLDDALLANQDLLDAFRNLCYTEDTSGRGGSFRRPVDFGNLGSEELGSVYESLLELHPNIDTDEGPFTLGTAAGNERKTTGSYYTPTSLINCLLDSALDPIISEAIEVNDPCEAERKLLDLKVCDPACGSGHFLIAAAERMAMHLARLRTGDDQPNTLDVQHAKRDIIGRCIYGVDINPMAVELCKVSLWMEALEPGKPLSFLDHHIQCGNSLLGATPRLLAEGIPDDAFSPMEGDDKKVCADLKKDNKKERSEYKAGQGYLFEPLFKLGNAAAEFAKLTAAEDDSLVSVTAKRQRYKDLVKGTNYRNARFWADTWCASFMWKKDESDLGRLCPTERKLRNIERSPHNVLPQVRDEVENLSAQYQFFHWHLAFPDVFLPSVDDKQNENSFCAWIGGFNVVLGNPPWDKIEILERETLSVFDESNVLVIENARNQQIERSTDCSRAFVRNCGGYPLCGQGRINSYSAFAELNLHIVGNNGFIGCVLPPGIATDDSTKEFIQYLTDNFFLKEFFAFTNRGYIFREIESTLSFALVCYGRRPHSQLRVAAQLWQVEHLLDKGRVYVLSRESIAMINPNTRNLPILQSTRDALLLERIYSRIPVLHREGCISESEWKSEFKQGLFNMTTKKGLFFGYEQLSDKGFSLNRNLFVDDDELFEPMYEAKLTSQFNHRHGSFEGVPKTQRFGTRAQTNKPTEVELQDPFWQPLPRYWVEKTDIENATPANWKHQWLMGFRNAISAVADARSVAFVVIPRVAVGNSMPLLFLYESPVVSAAILGNL